MFGFFTHRYGAMKICLSDEVFESLCFFDGAVIRRMQSTNNYVVYNGWNMGMLYSRDVYGVYGGYQGIKSARVCVVGKADFVQY